MAALYIPALLSLLLVQVYSLRLPRDAKFKITTIKEPPFLFVDEAKSGNAKFSGYIPDLLNKIKAKTNIDYELKLVDDGKYGSLKDGSNWSGMMGELLRGDAKVVAAPMTISDKRKEVIAFTTPFMDFDTAILYRKKDGEDAPISSAADLADQSEIKYGMVRGGSTETFFKNSQDANYRKMWGQIETGSDNVNKVEEGVSKVRSSDGKYAFIIEGPTADYWIAQKPCDLGRTNNGINKSSYGFALREGDGLKSKLDQVIGELKQNGDLDKLRRKWWQERSECSTSAAPQLVVSTFIVLCAVVATRVAP